MQLTKMDTKRPEFSFNFIVFPCRSWLDTFNFRYWQTINQLGFLMISHNTRLVIWGVDYQRDELLVFWIILQRDVTGDLRLTTGDRWWWPSFSVSLLSSLFHSLLIGEESQELPRTKGERNPVLGEVPNNVWTYVKIKVMRQYLRVSCSNYLVSPKSPAHYFSHSLGFAHNYSVMFGGDSTAHHSYHYLGVTWKEDLTTPLALLLYQVIGVVSWRLLLFFDL